MTPANMQPGDEEGDGEPLTPAERRKKHYRERVHLMVKAKRSVRNQNSEKRLVKAAEKELFLVHKEHAWARFEEACPKDEKWARFDEAFGNECLSHPTNATTCDSVLEATRAGEDFRDDDAEERSDKSEEQECVEEEKQSACNSSSFLGRCNIHWIDLTTPPAPKKKAVKRDTDKPKKGSDSSVRRRCSHDRRVVFHRYDELIDDDGKKDYIYSLHEREVEDELANYDVIDRVETAASDVGYFFNLLRKDLQAEAFNRIGRLRKQKEERGAEEEKTKTTTPQMASNIQHDNAGRRPRITV